MVRPRPAHRGQDIEGDLVVRLRVVDLWHLIRFARGAVVGAVVFQCPGRFAAEEVRFEAGVHDPAVQAQRGGEGGPHVAHGVEFFPDGARAELVLVVVEEDGSAVGVVLGQGIVSGFGG